jgi:hypothetical protein
VEEVDWRIGLQPSAEFNIANGENQLAFPMFTQEPGALTKAWMQLKLPVKNGKN